MNTIVLLLCTQQDAYPQQRHQYFDKFTTYDGLPNNRVRTILKDSKGYFWFGTSKGLAKYDGNKFTTFKSPDSSFFPDRLIHALVEDNNGVIWIAASNGLFNYKREVNKFEKVAFSGEFNKKDNRVLDLVITKDTILWACTRTELVKLDINTYASKHFSYPNNFIEDNIRIVDSDSMGNIYLKLDKGIFKFKEGTIRQFELISNQLFCGGIILDMKKGLQFGKIVEYAPAPWYYYNPYSKEIRQITNKYELRLNYSKQKIYAITSTSTFVYDNNFKLLDTHSYANLNINNDEAFQITSSYIDSYGAIWVGTTHGLFKIKSKGNFKYLNKQNGLDNCYVRSLMIDEDNNLYVGSKSTYHSNLFTNFLAEKTTKPISISYKHKTSVNQITALNSTNDLVLLASNRVLFLYNKKKGRIVDQQNSAKCFHWSVINYNDAMWVGDIGQPAMQKLRFINNEIVIDTVLKKAGTSSTAHAFYVDKENDFWVGGEGLFKMTYCSAEKKYNFEEFLSFSDTINNRQNPVWSIIELGKDFLLIGTTENGVFLLNKRNKKFMHFTVKHGLTSNVISSIVKDKNSNFWIATIDGLNFYDIQKHKLYRFYTRDGLICNDFNFKASTQAKDGTIFFGSKEGVLYFHPDSINIEKPTAQLHINELSIYDEVIQSEIEDGDTVKLNHNQGFFSFNFSLKEYRQPQKTLYKFKLEGIDKNYRETTGKDPNANYTNIPPGSYTFLLEAFDPLDNSMLNSLKTTIEIKPAYYQTIYFKMSIIAATILLLFTIGFQLVRRQVLRGRVYKLELDLLRTQMNPHFIFNTLNSIQHFILKNEKITAVDYLSKFAKLMRMSLNYSKIDYISVNKTINFIETYIKIEALNLKEDIQFVVSIDPTINKEKHLISPMVIQPFIENAIVHGLSPKNKNMKLEFILKDEVDYFHCIIKDNGIGRKKAMENKATKQQSYQSMGIEITQQRMMMQLRRRKIKKDSINIKDEYDNQNMPTGTTVCLKLSYKYRN